MRPASFQAVSAAGLVIDCTSGDEAAWQRYERHLSLERDDDSNGRVRREGSFHRRSGVEVADLPKQVKPVAVDDRAAVESASIVAHGYPDPNACTADDMHEDMSSLPTGESMLYRVGHQLIGNSQHGPLVRGWADAFEFNLKLHDELSRAAAGQNLLAVLL